MGSRPSVGRPGRPASPSTPEKRYPGNRSRNRPSTKLTESGPAVGGPLTTFHHCPSVAGRPSILNHTPGCLPQC
ncbi:hypothetical protein ACFFX0_24385 [Citricoccus parietis]|uniref:Uncharacterized protein n=1 Tax=Citricoccus parietis TaxID=592307 RepID=A0ABV5G5D7_9MICC